MATSLLDRRFIVLSGKGGVGRTTVAAVLAHAAAAQGKRVLIAQTDAAERLGKMLGHAGAIGPSVVTVASGIDAVNMTARESIHEYALLVLKYEAVYRALFANRAVRGFLSAIPGLDAYAMLGKAWWHTTQPGVAAAPPRARLFGSSAAAPPTAVGPWKYDLVILDGPASGHSIAMLKIPRAIVQATQTGPLVKDARALCELLADPQRAAVVVVTRPEELPASETRELVAAMRGDLRLPLGPVIVNAVPPARLAHPSVRLVMDRLGDQPTGDARLDATLQIAQGLQSQRGTAERVLAQLADNPGLPLVPLPWLPATALGPREIEQLARAFTGSGA